MSESKITRTHLLIPDTQVKPGIDLDYLRWVGQYIVDKKPDVIVHIGDHWDMPSLSSYDKGKKSFEGRRYKADIDAGNEGMKVLLKPLKDYNKKRRKFKEKMYKPEMHFTLGNHEARIERAVEEQAELDGILTYDDFKLDDWIVHDFKKPVFIDGIAYCHYFYNEFTGRAFGGSASNILNKLACSFSMGHRQVKDIAEKPLINGKMLRGLIAGACYDHDEAYKGYQGNHHWRGIILKTEVTDGKYNLIEVSLDYLRKRYA